MPRAPRLKGTGPRIIIHVAASWSLKSNLPAAWAATVTDCDVKQTRCLSGVLPAGPEVSNIRAEMIAVAETLESLSDDCTVTIWIPTDFLPKAIRYGYTRNANLDIWERLDRQLARHVIKRFRHEPLYFNKQEMLEVHERARAVAAEDIHNMNMENVANV